MRVNVYIDGFNLYYGCLKGGPHKWLNLERLCEQLLPRFELNRIRYFTARVRGRPDDYNAPVNQEAYLRAVFTLPRVDVHFGNFLTRPARMPLAHPTRSGPRTIEVLKTEEKGSDVNLATYLLVDAFRGDAEAFAVVSNDSDLTEPMRIVRHELGKVVGLITPRSSHSHGLMECRPTFTRQIRQGLLRASQFPPKIVDAVGETIAKPEGW